MPLVARLTIVNLSSKCRMYEQLLLAGLLLLLATSVSARPSSGLVVKRPDGSETTSDVRPTRWVRQLIRIDAIDLP